MKRHVKEVSRQSLTYINAHHNERCSCMPPSAFQQLPTQGQAEEGPDNAQATLITRELSGHLHKILSASFPRSIPFSLLLLHVSQREHILVHAGIGAVIIFPGVDQQGMYGIAERVYQSINLLQAETVIPPLRRIT